ncbi:hypothetical protein ABTK02_20960, partial [Acinetobacter baumannii]
VGDAVLSQQRHDLEIHCDFLVEPARAAIQPGTTRQVRDAGGGGTLRPPGVEAGPAQQAWSLRLEQGPVAALDGDELTTAFIETAVVRR